MRQLAARATFLLALALVAGGSSWLSQSGFEPSGEGAVRAYTLCPAPASRAAFAVLLSAIALGLVYTLVERQRRTIAHKSSTPTTRRCLAPLFLVGVNLAGLGVFVPALRDWWAPVSYVAVDLHAAFVVLATGACLVRIDAATGHRARALVAALGASADPVVRDRLREWATAAAVVGLVIATTPVLRFSTVIVGDEPKYLRFCELWLQGRGMSLAGVQDRSVLEPGHAWRLGDTVAAIVPAVASDLDSLGADGRRLARSRNFGRRFNRSRYLGSSIISGREGGEYQWHSPGISMLMLPAYSLDRWLFDTRTARFADDLFTVNLFFVLLFTAVVVLSLRLARTVAPGAFAVGAAASLCLSLPLGAFAFQFYPEMAGAAIVCAVCLLLVEDRPLPPARALGAGVMLGMLGWLHVRFVPLLAVGGVWLLCSCRRDWRSALSLVATTAVPATLLCLYAYHVTGSLLPSAFYQAEGVPSQFSWRLIPWGTVTEFFDRDFGLLPLAPVFLLTVGGLGVLARRTPRLALLVVSFGAALILPTGGHGVEVAGTTPGRFELAVLPLAALPLAAWFSAARRHPTLLGASIVLAVVSVAGCAAHDLQNHKDTVTMLSGSFSGWNPAILFPLFHSAHWMPTGYDRIALAFWIAVCVWLFVRGLSLSAAGTEPARSIRVSASRLAACAAALAVVGVAARLAGSPAREARFLVRAATSESTACPSAIRSGAFAVDRARY